MLFIKLKQQLIALIPILGIKNFYITITLTLISCSLVKDHARSFFKDIFNNGSRKPAV